MRGFRLFEKPLGVFSSVPPLRVVGSLPGYEQGTVYEGRLDIVDNIGKCTVELLDNNLPPGATAHVDNFTKEVVIRWPAFSPPDEEKDGIVNWNFAEDSLEGWIDLRGNSWIVGDYPPPPEFEVKPPASSNTRAAIMTGVGRGDHVLESIKYPVIPGQPVMARSLWDQGTSNKDNNNLWTAFAFYTPGGVMLEPNPWYQWYGDRIHDRTNKNRHWSTVNTNVPAGAGWATVRLVAHRRNGRNRWISASDVETSGLSYAVGVENGDDFYLTLRVRDSANRVAYWTGIVPYRSFFITSQLYGIVVDEDRLHVGFEQRDWTLKLGQQQVDGGHENAGTSFSIVGWEFVPYAPPSYEENEPCDVAFTIQGWVFRDPRVPYEQVEPIGTAFTIQGWVLKQQPSVNASDNIGTAFTMQGWTFT